MIQKLFEKPSTNVSNRVSRQIGLLIAAFGTFVVGGIVGAGLYGSFNNRRLDDLEDTLNKQEEARLQLVRIVQALSNDVLNNENRLNELNHIVESVVDALKDNVILTNTGIEADLITEALDSCDQELDVIISVYESAR